MDTYIPRGIFCKYATHVRLKDVYVLALGRKHFPAHQTSNGDETATLFYKHPPCDPYVVDWHYAEFLTPVNLQGEK